MRKKYKVKLTTGQRKQLLEVVHNGKQQAKMMCTQVSPGSMVKANDCPGYRFCSPKRENTEQPASTLKKKK